MPRYSRSSALPRSPCRSAIEPRCGPSSARSTVAAVAGRQCLIHDAPGETVRVRAASGAQVFELPVRNRGEPIPPAARDRLLQPFLRGASRSDPKGRGLGLYICAEIAGAHGGALDVSSTAEETRSTFRLPAG